jgi:CRISPR-associated protein (TIGR02710 family)
MVTREEIPVFLICTVGGSPQPVATALRELRPDVVWFLCSDGRNGKSSVPMVEEKEIGLRYTEGCPPDAKVFEIPLDDPDAAYKLCRVHLAQARRKYPAHRLIADYTGGTKSMTGALLMAAFAEPGVEVQFMLGKRSDLVQVESGTERPQRMMPDFIVAERDFAAAEQAVAGYDYAAAHAMLLGLSDRLRKASVKAPPDWSNRLEHALAWTGVMSDWDAFWHRKAAGDARARRARLMLETSGHFGTLQALGERNDEPRFDICADLWLNALRRGERGRYDDAVARLYRLVEATAQAHLWARHRLRSGRVPREELPPAMEASVRPIADRATGRVFAQLALDQTVELLRARDPADPFVAAYTAEGRPRPSWLNARNDSILAHGFTRIRAEVWESAKRWVEENMIEFFRGSLFEQLPRRIPDPRDSAV